MKRFSQRGHEIFHALFYETDINKSVELIESTNSENQLGIAFGKCCITFYYVQSYDKVKLLKTLEELEKVNKTLNDPFIHLWTHLMYFLHYIGMDFGIIDRELAIKHFDNATKWYSWYVSPENQNLSGLPAKFVVDEWEQYFITGWYMIQKAHRSRLMENDIKSAVTHTQEGVELWRKMPVDGKYMATVLPAAENQLGYFHLLSGNIEEAEKWDVRVLEATKSHGNLWAWWPNFQLYNVYRLQGDLISRKHNIKRCIEISKQFNFIYGLSLMSRTHGDDLFGDGKYKEALESYKEGIKCAHEFGDPLMIFYAEHELFYWNYYRYKVNGDKKYMQEAERIYNQLKAFADKEEHPAMIRHTRYCQAKILKLGNIRKKSKAIDILEELVDNNPYTLLELVDSLFEDVLLTGDEETIEQVDMYMNRIQSLEFFDNPAMVQPYSILQSLSAKYQFYIKKDPKTALNILQETKEKLSKYKFTHRVTMIDKEIQSMEQELSKWDNIDHSIRDRIKASEFNKYIQQALKTVDKQL